MMSVVLVVYSFLFLSYFLSSGLISIAPCMCRFVPKDCSVPSLRVDVVWFIQVLS